MNFRIQKYASLLCRLKIEEIIAVQRFSRENLKDKVVPIKNGVLKISRNNKMSILVLNTPSKISIVS